MKTIISYNYETANKKQTARVRIHLYSYAFIYIHTHSLHTLLFNVNFDNEDNHKNIKSS